MNELPPGALATALRAFPAAAPHALKAALTAAAPYIAAAERARLRNLCGDGSDIERMLNHNLDEDEAIDALMVIHELLKDPQ